MPSTSEELCLSCGFCCDGTLHNFTFLLHNELEFAELAGLRTRLRRDGIPIFYQPCSAYQAQACAIYEDRPRACQNYKCKLLLSLEAGETDLPTSLSYTHQVRQLIAALRALMPDPDPHLSLFQQVQVNWHAGSGLPDSAAPILLNLARLLHQHFGVHWLLRPSRFKRWKRRLQRR